jgi:hypothetical protein
MSVIRKRKRQRNFVTLDKAMLLNDKISLKAKGFWAYCMSKPDDWEFHVIQLEKVLLEGREAITSSINELIHFGYCERVQAKDPKGRFLAYDYEMLEESNLKECPGIFKKRLPQTGFPLTDEPRADNPQLLKNDLTKDRLNQETTSSPTPSKPEPLPVKPEKEVVVEEKLDPIERENEIVRKALYSSLDEVTAGAGMVWFLNDREAIRRACKKNLGGYVLAMVRKGVHLNPDAFSKPSSSANIELAKKIADKHGEKHNIIAEQQGLAFNFATGSVIFEYTDPEFEKQVLARLTAMKIVI